MTYRPIGISHSDFCFDTDEHHRCDACRLYGLPVDDRDASWTSPQSVTDQGPAMTAPEIHVTLCTERNMGDYGERVRLAYHVEPGETVEHLLMRLMKMGDFRPIYTHPLPASDWIELRYVEGTAPEFKDGVPF